MASSSFGHVSVNALRKQFSQRDAPNLLVLDDCNFEIEPGKLTVLMGPSGCGKSTLAYLLAGYIPPDAGTISIDGVALAGAGPDRMLVFQETALWPWMTVIENVMFGPLARKQMSRGEARESALALLHEFGLEGFADRYPKQLSGGMKRRAELAQALINRPKLMILDEPFRGLDVMTRGLMLEYYARLFERTRLTTLFITSELEEAIFLADRMLLMGRKGGQIVHTIDLDLPHPRTVETLTNEKYLAIKQSALAALSKFGGAEIDLKD
jgi:NitT/TauT family transport system ATP-binding protein